MAASDAALARLLRVFGQLGVTFTDAETKSLKALAAQKGATDDSILSEIRSNPGVYTSYHSRFPGITDLINAGRVANEGQFVQFERQYFSKINGAGISAYDSQKAAKTFELLNADVSVDEVDARIQAAQTIYRSASADVKKRLADDYGISTGDALGFLLDSGTKPILENKANEMIRKANLVARAAQYGLDLTKSEVSSVSDAIAGELAGYGKTYAGSVGALQNDALIRKNVGAVAATLSQEELLARIDNPNADISSLDSDLLKAAFGDQRKLLASQNRRLRERDRFSGKSGVGAGSLAVQRNL